MENACIQYYTVQVGSGLKDIGPLYHNVRFVQQGRGFGSFFETLFTYLKPVFKSGFNAIKESALKTGTSILNEVGSRPLNEILTEHGKKFGEDLGVKMKRKFQNGSGLIFTGAAKKIVCKNSIKAKPLQKRNQSASKRKPRKSTKKQKKIKTRILDIFSK